MQNSVGIKVIIIVFFKESSIRVPSNELIQCQVEVVYLVDPIVGVQTSFEDRVA